jgi:hypothetical protein
MQVGGAIGLAVLATVSAEHTQSLLDDGESLKSALNAGYHVAYLIGAAFAAIAASIAIFVLRAPAPMPAHGAEPESVADGEPEPALSSPE